MGYVCVGIYEEEWDVSVCVGIYEEEGGVSVCGGMCPYVWGESCERNGCNTLSTISLWVSPCICLDVYVNLRAMPGRIEKFGRVPNYKLCLT